MNATTAVQSKANAQLEDINLSAGSPVDHNTYEEYGIQVLPILSNGSDTGRRMVFREGEFLADVSNRYNLLPNEDVLDIADSLADDLGATPFNEFSGDWYMELDDHAITDQEGRRLHAMYSWEEDTVAGDDMNYGFIFHNSIDGSLGFSVGLFSFRHACSNMVWMGAGQSQEGMNFDDREVLNSYYHRHTEGLETDKAELKELAETTVSIIPEIHDTYEEWVDTGISIPEIKNLKNRLPHSDLPEWVQDALDVLSDRRENLDEGESLDESEVDTELLAQMPQGESTWDVYNDLTENIWHSDTTTDTSKTTKTKDLHRVLQPAEGVR